MTLFVCITPKSSYKTNGKRRRLRVAKLSMTCSGGISTSLCIFRSARALRRFSEVLLRRYVLSLRKVENERSAVAVDTGSVANTCSIRCILGKKDFSHETKASMAVDGRFAWSTFLHKSCQSAALCELTTNLVCSHGKVNLIAAKHANHIIEVRNTTVLW